MENKQQNQAQNQPQLSPIQLPSQPDWSFLSDFKWRREMAKDFRYFCLIYLSNYFYRSPASFHSDLMIKLSDHNIKRLLVVGFRGSAKSTLGSLALPIWMALEHPDKYQFIIPISDTSTQAALSIANIKTELDSNELLINDYGRIEFGKFHDPNPEPSLESDEEWQAKNMLLANGVRIMARSRGQKIRGLRHRASRPKVIIVDDPEDREWVKSRENRNKTDRWMRGEVMGALDPDGRLIAIGNWLHEDALMARLKKLSQFVTLEYPLVNDNDELMWPALFPTQKKIDDIREEMGDTAWLREMLLKVVAEEGQEIKPEDIHYYDTQPEVTRGALKGHGVDLAISTEESADFTTDVQGDVHYDDDDKPKIYIQKNPLNAHLDFYNTIEYFKGKPRGSHLFFVENVAYQKAAIQEMERNMMAVHPMKPIADKRSRLRVAARYIKNGTVLFPRTGCEKLIQQLLNFGNESHDDLCDALTLLILGLVEQRLDVRRVVIMR